MHDDPAPYRLSKRPSLEVTTPTRNRLIHAYFDIAFDTVWEMARDDLPPLIAELERILQEESTEQG